MDKIVLYEYWYDYTKPKHGDNAKLCYTDKDSIREFMYNLKASMQTLPGMLKQNLVHHTMKLKCHFTWAKIKKTNRTSEGWIGWENNERMCKPKT